MSSDPRQDEVTEAERGALREAALIFEDLRRERHEKGQKEYGEYTFLNTDTVRMAIEECADLVNYLTYTGIRLLMLRAALEEVEEEKARGFVGTKEGWQRE